MTNSTKMAPPHARHARRAVVRDGAVRPLPRSDVAFEPPDEFVTVRDFDRVVLVFLGRTDEPTRRAVDLPDDAVPVVVVGDRARVIIHRQLLLGRGDGHHIRQNHCTTAVNRGGAGGSE